MGQIIDSCLVDHCFVKQPDDSGDILLNTVERDVRLLEAKERRANQKFIQNIVHEEFDKGNARLELTLFFFVYLKKNLFRYI